MTLAIPFHSNITEAEYQKYFLYASAETSPHARIKATYTLWSLSLQCWAYSWVLVCSGLGLLLRIFLAKLCLGIVFFGKLQFLWVILLLISLSFLLHNFVRHTEIVVTLGQILRAHLLNNFGSTFRGLLALLSGCGSLCHYCLLGAIFFVIITLLLLLILRQIVFLW